MFNVYEPQCKVKIKGNSRKYYPVLIKMDKSPREMTEITIQRHIHWDRKNWGDLRLHMSIVPASSSWQMVGWDKILQYTFGDGEGAPFVAKTNIAANRFVKRKNRAVLDEIVLYEHPNRANNKADRYEGFMVWLRGDTTYEFGCSHQIIELTMTNFEGLILKDESLSESVELAVLPNVNYVEPRWRQMHLIGG